MPELKIEPLHIEGLSDFHCHCDYSVDAKGTIDEYCVAALRKGLAEICFTTHFDSNPNSDGFANFIRVKGEKLAATVENLAPYVDDVLAAQEKFYPEGLSVKLGLEFGWYANCEEAVLRLKERYDFDYLMAGVHEIHNVCYCCASTYEKCFEGLTLEQVIEDYYQQVSSAAKSGLFNTIAHLDYYRKYGYEYYGEHVNRAHREVIGDVFVALASTGTALEINTSARRKGFSSFFPQMEVVNGAKKAGVDMIFLGSDAHAPEQVGWEFDEAANLVPSTITGCED